jgi:hypothetical protein
MQIRIQNLFDPRSGIRGRKIRIRDKHPGSATLAQRQISLIISLVASVVD